MNSPTSKKAFLYLDAQGSKPALWHKLKKVEQLNSIVCKHLPQPLQPYCMATNFLNGKLTIIAANSTIASQLHFHTPEILRSLKQEPLFSGIQSIHCKVQVQTKRSFKTPNRTNIMKPLSQETAELITKIADGIDDVKLKEAIKRLAKHVK